MRRLEGGFINNVYLENGIVIKSFANDALVGIFSAERLKNEIRALNIFGGIVSPRLISFDETAISQEFIEGESYENMARRGDRIFEKAGAVLAQIHNFFIVVPRSLSAYYQTRFKKALLLAEPILKHERLSPVFDVSWEIVYKIGSKYIHGDFWLGNLIGQPNERPKAIDWEFSGVGSPYEDFAIAELWIFREFQGSSFEFWKGYGNMPDSKTINSFLILKCIEFLATTTLEKYLLEEKDGFYHNKVEVLKTLLQ